jgi:hypothetical protein
MSMVVRQVVAPDLFASNDVLSFQRERSPVVAGKSTPPLGAVSFVCIDSTHAASAESMDAAWAEEARPALSRASVLDPTRRLWLFCAHASWKPKNRIVRYSRLWKDFGRRVDLSGLSLGREIEVDSPRGVCFAAVAELPVDAILTAARIARRYPSCALLLSPRGGLDVQPVVQELFHAAFPAADSVAVLEVDWQHFATLRCPLGEIIGRVAGYPDDGETSLDLIMRPQDFSLFGA